MSQINNLEVLEPQIANGYGVFTGIVKVSKSTRDTLFGFKLHLIINDKEELLIYVMT